MLTISIHKTLTELLDLLSQLSNEDYTNPCEELSNSSIGAHTRHIIELFQCLQNQYESGTINYDNRLRDYGIQTDTIKAKMAITAILHSMPRPNKNLILQQVIDENEVTIESNYHRELLYNLEHCIHHQALIKVAVLQLKHLVIDEDFGVARSTIEYRKQCVQ
ncbi:DinB family protein [Flavobacterium soyangense]|uniref:DinB family protein n=1 Tax=Flavobacterium soyangense TaxID=2023265 RepID=A0A930XZ18_9FLAO|nr:DinB family protein [Flavobacterium soyangense]MBF2708423.1 DinB family protein [Flavobacterium soyangense]